jgi:uncharacterized membrane protein YkvA (DUF1232 family)
MDWKKRAEQLKTDLPAVFLCMKQKDTPVLAKIVGMLAVAYALSPVDLIPDFIPVLGYLDDLLIVPALIAWMIRLVPPAVMRRCREQAQGMWQDGRPKKWYYALPVLILWALILWWLWQIFHH